MSPTPAISDVEEEEKKSRGQPADISGNQWNSLIAYSGQDWLDAVKANKKAWKANALDKGLSYLMAKYGVLDPWRKRTPDEPEPLEGVNCADDTSGLSQEKLKALQDKMRKSINRAYNRYLTMQSEPAVKSEKKEANEASKTFLQILAEMRADKSKIFVHKVVGEYFWQPEWEDELEAEYVAKCSAPSGPNNKVALRMNVKREFLIAKLEEMDGDTKAKVAEKVAELQKRAQESFNKTLNVNTVTPEDCARFADDIEGFAEKFVDILAEGTKGVVLLMVACPSVDEDGEIGVGVKRYEWSSIPAELGRAGLSYSEVDVKMFRHMVERFRSFGRKVYDANFTKAELERGREEAFDELVEWQTTVAAAGGHGIMGGQISHKGAVPQRPEGKDRLPKSSGGQAPHSDGSDAVGQKPRKPRTPRSPKPSPKPRGDSSDSSEDSGSGSETQTDESHGLSLFQDEEDYPAVVEDDEEDTPSRKGGTSGRAGANAVADTEASSLAPRKRGPSYRPLVIQSDGEDADVDEDSGEVVRKGLKGKALGVKSGGAAKVTAASTAEKETAPKGKALGVRSGGAAKVTAASTAEKETAPAPAMKLGDADGLQAPFTQKDRPTAARTPDFKSIFYGLDPRATMSKEPKAADVIVMVHEKIKGLTYVTSAQPLYGTRGRISQAGKFLMEVGERCRTWSVSESVVYALLDAYLEFERASPPAAKTECEGWAEIEVNGDEMAVRPAYMREWAASAQKCAWVAAAARDDEAADGLLDWDFGAALLRQWVELQPAERCKKGRITRVATEDMDWGEGLNGGKLGARTLVIALLLWADAMEDVVDGTSEEDWDKAAADFAQVLTVRGCQIRAQAAVTLEKSGEGGRAKEKGQVAEVAPAGRERTKSKTLAYMEANGRVYLPEGLKTLGGGKASGDVAEAVDKKQKAAKKVAEDKGKADKKAIEGKGKEVEKKKKKTEKRKKDSETVEGGETSESKKQASGSRKRSKH